MKGTSNFTRICAFLLMCFVLLSLTFSTVYAQATVNPSNQSMQMENSVSLSAVDDYNSYFGGFTYELGTQTISLSMAEVTLSKDKSLLCTISVPQDGLYEFTLSYVCLSTENVVLSLSIDGALPFSEADALKFPMYWVNNPEDVGKCDKQGNEFAPEQILYDGVASSVARNYTGSQEHPYQFALSVGEHVVELRVKKGSCLLKSAVFSAPENVLSYTVPSASKLDVTPIVIEGETAELKNDRTLIPLSNQSSVKLSPCNPTVSKLNYIGGSNSGAPGSELTWSFHVEQAGYYSLGYSFRQNTAIGSVAYRHLLIDGETPFKEAERVAFKYADGWQYDVFDKNDTPYYFYFSAGDHTLTLRTTPGGIAEIYADMQRAVANIGDLYVDITKIVGETVDANRSYELFKQIPGFNEKLAEIITVLEATAEKLEELQEVNSGSTVSTIRNAVRIIRLMHDNPYSAHRHKASFYDSYTNLSALMSTMTSMPIDIDRIFFIGYGDDACPGKVSFFESLKFTFTRFISSFFNDYNTTSESQDEELTVWVNWGRDQAKALTNLIQDSFVREHNIDVNVSIVNASLVQAIIAGKGPDVLLQMARTEPVNLAMRGALVDLSEFSDFETVLDRFTEGSTIPYQFNDGVYALPDTQNFFMMFARTDILEKMGIAIPKTWDEFINATTLLQRNNLQVSLPYAQITDSGTVNAGVGGLSLYPTLLIQNGLELYNEQGTACLLTETPQIQVFNNYVNWYTKYKILTTTDFFNRFRVGSAPLGVSSYTLYVQLQAAAPEIAGRWVVAPLPGTMNEDGTINNTSAGSGTGCAITKISNNPEAAWKFLKWWTSKETQLSYSNTLESVLGPLGRVNTSNLEALSAMEWDDEMYACIDEQHHKVVEIPEIPGGYYTARGIDQVYWGTVEQGGKVAELMKKWGAIVNGEIARKRDEYCN